MNHSPVEIVVTVVANAPAAEAWTALIDWDRQGDWILGTRVRGTKQGGRGVGGGVEAWTGIGPLGFLDTMEITTWDPPNRCLVRHTGRVIRGTGAFQVADAGGGRCEILWSERLDLPFGPLGRLSWLLTKPAVRWGIVRSLSKLCRQIENGKWSEAAGTDS